MSKARQSTAKPALGSRIFAAGIQINGSGASESISSLNLRTMKSGKGARTRTRIISAAFAMAKHDGLPSVTLARLADTLQMSKSGIFSRIGSIETLQTAVVARYVSEFNRSVLYPALRHPPGLLRLETLFERWVAYGGLAEDAGCLWMSSLAAMKDGHEVTRRTLQALERRWQETLCVLIQQAIESGQLSPSCDPKAIIFEMQALVLAVHHKRYFLGTVNTSPYAFSSFRRLLRSCGDAPSGHGPLGRQKGCRGDDMMNWPTLGETIDIRIQTHQSFAKTEAGIPEDAQPQTVN